MIINKIQNSICGQLHLVSNLIAKWCPMLCRIQIELNNFNFIQTGSIPENGLGFMRNVMEWHVEDCNY